MTASAPLDLGSAGRLRAPLSPAHVPSTPGAGGAREGRDVGSLARADGASSQESEGAVTVGHGRVRQLTSLQVGRHSLAMNSTSGAPTNLQRGLSVKADPVTGGLVGLPESWAGLLPQGLSEAPRSAESVPESLRVASVPEEALNIELSNPDPHP